MTGQGLGFHSRRNPRLSGVSRQHAREDLNPPPSEPLTGQQFQSADNEPYYVLVNDCTPIKLYRRSLCDACVLEEATFDSFSHVEGWVPQRFVTAADPDPLRVCPLCVALIPRPGSSGKR